MRALILADIPIPVPQKGQVRVRVHTSGLNPADHKVALGKVKFLHARNFPMVLGYDFSGVIDEVGSPGGEPALWKVGDEVFGFLPYSMSNRRGAFAEFLIADANEIARKPSTVSHFQAAGSATPGLTAVQAIRTCGKLTSSGGRVLVTGVSGGVGSLAISIVQKMGATAVGIGSGRGLELAKSLGASVVVDRKLPTWYDQAQGPFDVVFDSAAAYSWSQWKGKIKSGGMYVTTLPSLTAIADKVRSLFASSGTAFVIVKANTADLQLLGGWLESGMKVTVDSTIPVRDVGKGLAKLQQGGVLGRIVVDVLHGF
jgi:NADPH:quinone reductase-like Zn-dependent oxidoreductase